MIRHRLFPALVALWLAALFGLSSFVVPVALLERVVGATGLAGLVPAAAPPLGFTARLLIALALSGAGAALGLAIAVALRRSGRQAPAPAIAPAAAEEAAPRLRLRDRHPDAPARAPISAHRDLGEAHFDTLVEDQPSAADETPEGVSPEPEPTALASGPAFESPPEIDAAPLKPASLVEEDEDLVVPADDADADDVVADDVATDDVATDDVATNDVPAEPRSSSTVSPVVHLPLHSLGTVQLVERLAAAIAARREAGLGVPPAVAALAERFGDLNAPPEALASSDADEDDAIEALEPDEEDEASASRYSSLVEMTSPFHRRPPAEVNEDGFANSGSPLAARAAARPAPADPAMMRIVDPGPLAADPDGAERALREALDDLKRMTGPR